MTAISLIVEDVLSRVVALEMLRHSGQRFYPTVMRDSGGCGWIRSNIKGLNQAAQGSAFFILTDLDQYPCAPSLRDEWVLPQTIHTNLIFRIAVREVEAWILADRIGFAKFLGVNENLLTQDPDILPDPKAELIRLAKKCRKRAIRESIVPDDRSMAKQGPDYNGVLSEFVTKYWKISAAESLSPSLARAMKHLRKFRFQES